MSHSAFMARLVSKHNSLVVLLLQIGLFGSAAQAADLPVISSFEIISRTVLSTDSSQLHVNIVDSATGEPLPVRAIVTGPDGQHPDGSGRGLYADGRFFADGDFLVSVPAGETQLQLSHGPHYVPLDFSLTLQPRQLTHVKVKLAAWFSPATRGWYAGDNHVHAQHDQQAAVKTDLAYTALQARAVGLNFVTEAGSNVSYDDIDKLDRPDFLLRYAGELRPGPYVGHINTPGVSHTIAGELYDQLIDQPLPVRALLSTIHQRGGVAIYTHPMTPRHQLHWMGATEAYSDAALGECADLFDVDANHVQQLWFAILNLGNRVGVSSYTDSALGRKNTLSPGDRRVYCRAERFDYPAIIDAMRQARTMATNGGPVFVFLSVADKQPGDTLVPETDRVTASLEVHSLNPLQSVELYQDGVRVGAFNVGGLSGALEFDQEIDVPRGKDSWLVARAQDKHGKWCLTSPVFFQAEHKDRAQDPAEISSLLLEISNATRFVELRPQFFAHWLVTVREPEQLARVELKRDTQTVQLLRPADGNHLDDGKVPVTAMGDEYAAGWIWYPTTDRPCHFQADTPVEESGWYSVQATTATGRVIKSDQIYFDRENPQSHAISLANLTGPETLFSLWGYSEEVPLAELRPPFSQGEWWYPRNGFWRVTTQFADHVTRLGWPADQPVERFRQSP